MAGNRPCAPKSAPCPLVRVPERPLQVKVVGLFKDSDFQVAKIIVEALKHNYPSKFEEPLIVPLQEFAWNQYLLEKKRELKDETWEYSSYVMCFVNDRLLGDTLDLKNWAQKVWDMVDVRPPALYEALTLDYSTEFLKDTKHNFVFLDIHINLTPVGRLVFELYCDACPKTCRNFELLCTGQSGVSERGVRLHYKDSIFHRVVQNGWIQGGDIVEGKGDDGESVYGPTFEGTPAPPPMIRSFCYHGCHASTGFVFLESPDENFSIPHNKRGVLGMVNKGHHTNGSQFYITLQSTPYLDGKYVAFGQCIEGIEVLRQLELVPTENERPVLLCRISDSGRLYI